MFTFLLIVQTIVAVSLCAVILMQRSEGGGLGVGGSSAGLMTARGAADFLTRATSILGTLFVVLCIALAALAGTRDSGQALDASVANQTAPAAPLQTGSNPLGGTPPAPATAPQNGATPAAQSPADNGAVPLAQ